MTPQSNNNAWRFLDTGTARGAENMAIDEALLVHCRETGRPVIRFYGWDPPTLSLGFFQKATREVDPDRCREEGIDLVRRPTGGRAVLHDRELTYSVIIPEDHPLMPRTVTESYRRISMALLAGFHKLGIPATLSGETTIRTADFRSAACFEAPSSYEVVVDGKKIVGSAQVRRDGMILQHGAIMIDWDVDQLFRVLITKDRDSAQRMKVFLRQKATTIREVTGQTPDYDTLSQAFFGGFRDELAPGLQADRLSRDEQTTARRLCRDKYDHSDWTFRK